MTNNTTITINFTKTYCIKLSHEQVNPFLLADRRLIVMFGVMDLKPANILCYVMHDCEFTPIKHDEVSTHHSNLAIAHSPNCILHIWECMSEFSIGCWWKIQKLQENRHCISIKMRSVTAHHHTSTLHANLVKMWCMCSRCSNWNYWDANVPSREKPHHSLTAICHRLLMVMHVHH